MVSNRIEKQVYLLRLSRRSSSGMFVIRRHTLALSDVVPWPLVTRMAALRHRALATATAASSAIFGFSFPE